MFFGGPFFGGGFFGGLGGGGKGDNAPSARAIFKPTGIADRPKLKAKQTKIEERLAETAETHAEVIAAAKQEFLEPAVTMSLSEIDMEIGRLLQKAMRTDDDEVMLLILMAAAAC